MHGHCVRTCSALAKQTDHGNRALGRDEVVVAAVALLTLLALEAVGLLVGWFVGLLAGWLADW